MGIKFKCPNGHKLNVKSFLAGRRAVCPKCSAKVVVPSSSEGAEISPREADDVDAIIEGAHRRSSRTSAKTDPIAEAPAAVWYVQHPTGGQFGPAAGEVMRGWLAEGRVSSDSMVWRAGWPEWQPAVKLFPQLATQVRGKGPLPPLQKDFDSFTDLLNSPPPFVKAPVVAVGLPARPAMPGPASLGLDNPLPLAHRGRRKAADATMVVSGMLLALVIVLCIVLGFVVLRQNAEPEPEPTKTEAPAAESGL
jgi:hypothetical protein